MIKSLGIVNGLATRISLFLSIFLVGLAHPSRAQVFDFDFGVGRVFGGVPAVPVIEIGVAAWPAPRWGVAARLVRGLGEDLRDPVPGGDRTFLGTNDLRAWGVTTRFRVRGVEIGGGLGRRRYHDIVLLHFVDAPMRRSVRRGEAGVILEAFYKHTVWPHFSIKGGLTYDAWVDGADYVRPVLLATVWP